MARKIKHCARFSAQARHDRRVDALYNAEMHGSRSMAIPTRIDLAAPSHEDDGFSPARRDGPMDVPMQMVSAQAPDGPVDGTPPVARAHAGVQCGLVEAGDDDVDCWAWVRACV